MTNQEKEDSFNAVYSFVQNAGLLKNNPNRNIFKDIVVQFNDYFDTIEIDTYPCYNPPYASIYYENNHKKINTKEVLCEWDDKNKTLIIDKKIKIKIK